MIGAGRGEADRQSTSDGAAFGARRFWWGFAAVLVVGVGVLLWSKWGPYAGKVVDLSATGRWSEREDVLRVGGVRPGDPPSWAAAGSFAAAYFGEVARALVAAVVGTLLVIPTAAEIPILQALVLVGVSDGVVGALLVTLPAVSLPGMVMLRSGIGMRAATATAGVVVLGGVAAGGVLGVL